MFDEAALIGKARLGDPQAFETLVLRYQRYVYNLALRVVGNPLDAEDIAQQAFVKAWRGLPQFKGEAHFSTWLYRIVTNVCYDHLPRIKRDLTTLQSDDVIVDVPDEQQGVERTVLSDEECRLLHEALNKLPESYRLLLTLRHLQELSYEEIASVTGMPLGTVKTGIFRARQKLKTALQYQEVVYVR
jgi:RNA polymerase sigma-70 factor (ECF subfamily)